MIRTTLLPIATGCAFMATAGCSSVMSHTGADQGYYPGTRANVAMMKSDDTSWALTPLLAVELPFSAVADTLMLPYDYYRAGRDKAPDSPRERIRQSEARTLATSGATQVAANP